MNDKNAVLEKIIKAFPFLKDAGKEVIEQMLRHSLITDIPKGKVIFFEGDECKHLAFILSGVVRIYKPAESGREITLYRLGTGESCVLTASCIFAKDSFPAVAITEEDVEAALVPSIIFRDWINHYEIWRNYIFSLLSKRLSEVIATLEEVAFRRMDIRIAEFLFKLSGTDKNEIIMTHQDIAMELGTSREVVSRILKHFEYEHLITLKRNHIAIDNVDSLKKKMEQNKF
jgi:CRP/FNR family transcriptional regulator